MGLRGRWELVAIPSHWRSEGGQVTDLAAGVTQETRNCMLVTATLDHLNHTAAMSQMLSLGISENKQTEAALALVVALSSDYLAPPSVLVLPALADPAAGESVMGAEGSANKLVSVNSIEYTASTVWSPLPFSAALKTCDSTGWHLRHLLEVVGVSGKSGLLRPLLCCSSPAA